MDKDNFHRHFQRSAADIEDRIRTLPQDDHSRTAVLKACSLSLATLSAEVRHIVDALPARDRQTYANGIKALSTRLDLLQAPAKSSKQRFAFKSSFKGPQPVARPVDESTTTTQIDSNRNITSKHGQTVDSAPEDLAIISDLEECLVRLRSIAPLSTLRVRNVVRSVVMLPLTGGPIYFEGVTHSIIVASCHQFRMHNSENCEVYLHCGSRPILEDCKGIRFAPLDLTTATENKWDQVDDFKWLRNEPSPNWSLIPVDSRRDVEELTLQVALQNSQDIPTFIDTIGLP